MNKSSSLVCPIIYFKKVISLCFLNTLHLVTVVLDVISAPPLLCSLSLSFVRKRYQ